MATTRTITVHDPESAAKMLAGISVPQLIGLLKVGGYSYTSLMPGAKPWGRGRQVWGLTDDQISAIVADQERAMPSPVSRGKPERPSDKLPGHDGKSRVKQVRVRS